MDLVTVFNTFNPAEAQLVRSRLEAAGIPAHLNHETAALTTEGYALTVGGIQVQVADDQAVEARALLTDATETDGTAGA